MFLPYGQQKIDDADIAAVVEVLRSDFLTTGPVPARFEEAFAQVAGAPHAVCCSSGTAALHLSYAALGLGPGDRVIVPSVTFLATANAARITGAEIVFADVDPDTALLTPATLEAALEKAGGPVAAIAPVHMAGQMVDMAAVHEIAVRAGARVVEDACHALGGRDAAGQPVGAGAGAGGGGGSLAAFSLHPVKAIAAGEGGVVTTADDDLAENVRRLRNHGMVRGAFADLAQAFASDGTPNPWYYEMPAPGFNYRLSDIHAALALSQLAKLDGFVARRAELVARYDAAFAQLPENIASRLRPMARREGRGVPAWHLYVCLVDFEAFRRDRAVVMNDLKAAEIGTQVHYLPLHRQPYYRERYGDHDLPGADSWYARALSLPLHPNMTDADVDRVVGALLDALEPRA